MTKEISMTNKIVEKALELIRIAKRDKRVYGDQYVEFGERSIRILDPTKIRIKLDKKSKIKEVLYGKSIIQAMIKK